MEFTKSLRSALITEVENLQESHGASFEEDGPPELTIETKVTRRWLWVTSKAHYKGRTWHQATDRLSGDPYSAHVFHDWVGEAKTAPKVVKRLEDLHGWALLHTEYEREYTDVGSWGRHAGRYMDDVTPEGIVKVRVNSKDTFHDVSPGTETTTFKVDLSIFDDRSTYALKKLLKRRNPIIRMIAAKLLGLAGLEHRW